MVQHGHEVSGRSVSGKELVHNLGEFGVDLPVDCEFPVAIGRVVVALHTEIADATHKGGACVENEDPSSSACSWIIGEVPQETCGHEVLLLVHIPGTGSVLAPPN